MSPETAAIVYALVIAGLFWLDRDERARTSIALWIPVVWLGMACSRSVSEWLEWEGPADSTDQYMEGSPIDRLVFTTLLAVGLVVLISRRKQIGILLRRSGPILWFFLYCGISIVWSDYPEVAFKRWIKILGDFVMVLIVLSEREPSTAIKRFLARTTYPLIPLSILFIKYFPTLGRTYNQFVYTPVYIGVTTNKNALGQMCLLLGLASLWRVTAVCQSPQGAGRTRRLIAHGAILAMVLWLFLIADSMTSLACFLLAGGLLVATNFAAVFRRPAVVHVLVASVVVLTVSVLFFGVGAGLVKHTMARDTTTLTERTEVWNRVIGLAGNPLFGTGFESFWLGKRLEKMWSYNHAIMQAHNGYLEIYLNLGWVGLTVLAMVLVMGYRRIAASVRKHQETACLWLAYFAVAVIYNFTEAAFRMMTPVWILFLLAITCVPDLLQPRLRTSTRFLRRSHDAHMPESTSNPESRTALEAF